MATDCDQSSRPSSSSSSSSFFDRDHHVAFLEMMYQILPSAYQSQEINHLTLAYFVISGLDILQADRVVIRVDKDTVASWVLSFQAHPINKAELNDGRFYGFHGSRTSQFPPDDTGVLLNNGCHLASTYCALAILKIIGYDFSNFDSESISASVRNLQQPDGSFYCYLAALCPSILGQRLIFGLFTALVREKDVMELSGVNMDKERAKEYILNCQSYDGGFGLIPGSESHGGGTYCAVASLRLMGFLQADMHSINAPSTPIDVPSLLDWYYPFLDPLFDLVGTEFGQMKQAADGGFQGRADKPSDTCYAFWIGSILRILGGHNLIFHVKYGGFSKFPRQLPDLYHSYYGLTAFSLLEEPLLEPLCLNSG